MITCKANSKFYIGKSNNCSARLKDHFKILERGGHSNKDMQSDYNNYGANSFTREVLEYCSITDLHNREVFFIKEYDALNKGYNKELPNIIKEEVPYVNGVIKIYSLHDKSILAETPGIREAAILLKVTIKRINNVIKATNPRQIKGVLKDYIIIEEGFSLEEFENNLNKVMDNRIKKSTKLSKEEFAKKQLANAKKAGIKARIPVGKFNTEGVLLEEFTHAGEICDKYPEFKYKGLYKCISGEYKTYKGFIWKYL
jgi:group I intron endonuclease